MLEPQASSTSQSPSPLLDHESQLTARNSFGRWIRGFFLACEWVLALGRGKAPQRDRDRVLTQNHHSGNSVLGNSGPLYIISRT